MSNKQLLSRLDGLFAELELNNGDHDLEQFQETLGWTWECDPDGVIITCSTEVKFILGIPAEEFIGKNINTFCLTPDSADSLSSVIQANDVQKDVRLAYISSDGDIVQTITHLNPSPYPSINNSRPGWHGRVRVSADLSPPTHTTSTRSIILEPDTSPIWSQSPVFEPRRGMPTGFLADTEQITPTDNMLTTIGKESIQYQRLLFQNAGAEESAELAVPTLNRDGSANLLLEILDNQSVRRWSEDELQLVEHIADQLALALENAQLFEQIQTQAEELSILRQVSLELAKEQHDLESVLDIIIRRVVELLNSDSAAIWLWETDQEKLALKTIYQSGELIQDATAIKFSDELPELAFRNKKTQIVSDYIYQESVRENHTIDPPLPAIAVPLIWQTQVAGVLLVTRKHGEPFYTSGERHLVELFAAQATAVIQNALLFNQTQNALDETDLLYKASAELNASVTYQDILEILRQYTILGVQSKEVTINVFDRPWENNAVPDWYDQVACWPYNHNSKTLPPRYAIISLRSGIEIMSATSPTIIEDIASDMRVSAASREMYTKRYSARSILFAPLVSSGQWIGYITAIYQKTTNFPKSAIRRLSALTGQAAFAVQNLRLLEESKRRADELQTAAEIARDTTGTLSLDILLNRTADLIREKFNYYHTTIFLLDERGTTAYPRASTSKTIIKKSDGQQSLAVGSNTVIGYVTQVGEHLLINDISQDPLRSPGALLPDTRADLGIPLKIGDRVIGALDVQSTNVNAFTLNDIAVLQILADQIAVAVENARSYEISLQAMEEMRKADQLKSQFLANMSHELRTPLNSIIGFSRVIIKGIDGPINETQHQDLQAIYSSGQHLLSLINDILDLSKIEAGKMELSIEDKVNISDLVQSVMSTTTGLVKDKPIDIFCTLDPDLPLLRADPLKIRQVLLNLISNAAKFTDQGSITIRVEKFADQAMIRISVIDTGKGISPEDQKKLFLPFSQVDASPTRKTGGSGLGLSICRHLIDMHHGEIGVHSQVGKGSTFYFTLPTAQTRETAQFIDDVIPTRTILCIENERQLVNLYDRYLVSHGYQVIPLTDPKICIDTVRNINPRAITLDIGLLDTDGWEILRELKTDPSTSHIPVIICSVIDEKEKAAALGADDYLLKPILEEDFVNTINNIVRDDRP